MLGKLGIFALLLAATACGGGGDDNKSGTGGKGGSGGAVGGGGGSGGGVGGGSGGAVGGGGSGGGVGGSGVGGAAGYPGTNPNLDCPGKLDPLPHTGQTITVGTGTAASCTEAALQAGVAQINGGSGGDTLVFDCGGGATIALTASLKFTKSAIVDGGGKITLSGGNAVRVIELDHYLDFVLQSITVKDGFVPAGADNESGAGLLSPWFGTLKVINVAFDHNVSASTNHDVGGGAIYQGGLTDAVISGCTFTNNSGSTGGGILNRSTNLTLVNSVFFQNSATTEGDGQYGNGGGLYIDRMWLDAPKDLVICGSVFQQNHAKVHGSAIFSYDLEGSGATFDRLVIDGNDMAGSTAGGTGTVYHEGVPLLLVASTFSNNVTGAHAGGLFLGGGSDAHVENCTFSGNVTPGNAGALWAGNGKVDVLNVTFSENKADYGPVIFKGDSGSVKLTNVVFSNNKTDNQYSALACHATFDDGGGNVQWPDKKNNGNADMPCAAGIKFADPGLAALADNGGPTKTMAIAAGSPAVDVADTCPTYDQRGKPRVGKCDSGAFEYQP